jgi:hypothetical protein
MLPDLWLLRQPSVERIGTDYLFTRLAQTIAWCCANARSDAPMTSVRTPDLMPKLLCSNRDEAISDVGSSRGWRVRTEVPDTVSAIPNLRRGRLLIYFPDDELCDGAAEVESKGFYDTHNTPGWDTWVSYFEDDVDRRRRTNYLLAYVPPQLVEFAEIGIAVNPEECIAWLPDCDISLRAYLAPYLDHLPWWKT